MTELALRTTGGLGASAVKLFAVIGISINRRLANLGEVLVRSTFLVMVLFVFAQLWRTVGERVEAHPGGYDIAHLVWYLAFADAIVFTTGGTWDLDLDREVRTGDIAYRLARPLSYPVYHFARAFGDRLVRFGVCLTVGAIVSLVLVGPIRLTAATVGAGLLTSLVSLAVDEMITLSVSFGAFWIENTSGLHLLYRRAALLLGGAFIPLEAYPEWLGRVCRLLPLRHLVAGPARLYLGEGPGTLLTVLSAQLVLAAAALALLVAVYRLGIRRVAAQGG